MIFAIGDIHGYRDKLDKLLVRLSQEGMTDENTLVFIGDYIDRGPDSAGVIRRLMDLKSTRPNTIFLRGNHEQLMLDARQIYNSEFNSDNPAGGCESGRYWHIEGGLQTLRSYGRNPDIHWSKIVPEQHWQFMLSTRIEFDCGNYKFVHAGVLPPGCKWNIADFPADPRLWIRTEFHISESDFDGKTVVFGHTPTAEGKPVILWNKIGIDTGAGFGGPLPAVGLKPKYDQHDVLVVQVKSVD